jgi:hypothetical protein
MRCATPVLEGGSEVGNSRGLVLVLSTTFGSSLLFLEQPREYACKQNTLLPQSKDNCGSGRRPACFQFDLVDGSCRECFNQAVYLIKTVLIQALTIGAQI